MGKLPERLHGFEASKIYMDELAGAHHDMVDALAYALHGIGEGYKIPRKRWYRKLLERFCRWLMTKLEIYEDE